MSVILEKPLSNYDFFIYNKKWYKIPEGYESLVSLRKDKKFALIILDKKDIIYYRIDNKVDMDKELLKIIEEKIITDDMENIFVYLTEVPSEYFPTLSILLQGTEYRNLSHRQLIDKIIPEIPKDRFFALYHDDKIENVSKEFVLEDLYDRIMTDTDAYIGTDIQISGTNLKFHFDYETDDFKDNINEVTNHVMIFEALLHLPIVDRIKLQELINIGKDILKRYQNYLSLKD